MEGHEWAYPTAFSSWGDEEHAAIDRVLSRGKFTAGEEVEAFEYEFASGHGMKHAIAVNSGSSANLLMVDALTKKADTPLRPGDVAIVPGLAWPTTYAPIEQHGLLMRIVDCDDTWNAPPVEPSATGGERLIVACSILGNPGYLESWRRIANDIGAYFIEDECESLGAVTADDCRVGTLGIMSSFSFYFSHQLSAIEGGMILTDDSELDHICRMLRDHGLVRGVVPRDDLGFTNEYRCDFFGYNLRMTEIHAAIGREQWKKLWRFRQARRGNYKYFTRKAQGLPIDLPRWQGTPSPFGIHFMVKNEETRARLATAFRKQGVDCRPPAGGCITQHPYGRRWREQFDLPFATDIHRRGMFLGNAPFEIFDRIDAAIDVMRAVL
jgi:CDP-6-deoxy-D-xylo-4-hexulose-3-dehydrase